MVRNNLVCKSVNFAIGIFNIVAIVPLLLTFGLIILVLCAVDLSIFIACTLGTLKIAIPSLPFDFQSNSIILRIIIVCLLVIAGYYLYKFKWFIINTVNKFNIALAIVNIWLRLLLFL